LEQQTLCCNQLQKKGTGGLPKHSNFTQNQVTDYTGEVLNLQANKI
jgi:hypothetical protein